MTTRVGVFGLGDVLRGDDGFGPAVVRRLKRCYEFDAHVVVRDVGTAGSGLATQLHDLDAAIFLDTIEAPGEPGALQVLDRSARRAGRGARRTTHERDVGEALESARLAGHAPDDVRLVAAIPADVDMGPGFSSAIAAACDEACAIVVNELQRLGHAPHSRGWGAPPARWQKG
ncbi:MAG: hydrogenase maturation protease [Planctomycetota bacterium]|jgi:hydrogenase maturation protease